MTVAEASNAITVLPRLLAVRDVSGCLITMDAPGTQTEIVKPIVAQEASICSLSRRIRDAWTQPWTACWQMYPSSIMGHARSAMPDRCPGNRDGWRFVRAGRLLTQHSWRIGRKIAGGRGYRTTAPRLPFITTSLCIRVPS